MTVDEAVRLYRLYVPSDDHDDLSPELRKVVNETVAEIQKVFRGSLRRYKLKPRDEKDV